MKNTTHTVIGQNWEESERGWGTRPDGFTLHLTEADHKQFVINYLAKQKEYFDEALGPGITPSEYTRTYGSPKQITVNDITYQALARVKDEFGIWGKGKSLPSAVDGTSISVHVPKE